MFSLQINRGCRFDSIGNSFESLESAKQYAERFMDDNPYDGGEVYVYDGNTYAGKVLRYPNIRGERWIPYHVGCFSNGF